MRISIWSCRLIGALCLVVAGGCNGDDTKPFKNLVPVTGYVSFQGEPLEHGIVSFAPVAPDGQAATGQVTNGRFTMMTTVSARGVIAGKYKVIVESNETSDGAPSTNPSQLYAKPKSLIPEKYKSVATSGLEIEVVSGMPAPNWNLEP
ncbi:MAG: hypothetical protein JWN70_1243 [Planctomycetaceae bacterium]|nr:hypothetical protein [Planctomycetaceae bacterium]